MIHHAPCCLWKTMGKDCHPLANQITGITNLQGFKIKVYIQI